MLDEIDGEFRHTGLDQAVASGSTPPIFDWLLTAFSFQGISDQVARSYMEKHGTASWSKMEASLQTSPSCQELQTYRHYEGCRYDKGSFTCAERNHIDAWPTAPQGLQGSPDSFSENENRQNTAKVPDRAQRIPDEIPDARRPFREGAGVKIS